MILCLVFCYLSLFGDFWVVKEKSDVIEAPSLPAMLSLFSCLKWTPFYVCISAPVLNLWRRIFIKSS